MSLAWLLTLDLRWLTAICLMLVGTGLVALAIKVWWMPLHRRAVLFEPYLTAKGVKLLLDAWPVVFVGGTFLVVCGASKWAYYSRWNGGVGDEVASGIGLLEAILSLWTAGSVTAVTWRAWRGS